MEFTPFAKIGRWNRETIITEKIDGTNAQIYIREMDMETDLGKNRTPWIYGGNDNATGGRGNLVIFAGSKSRWITPGKKNDNHGFAQWVEDNGKALLSLGPGHHFGEWWGKGIQRHYNMWEKRFSLFDVVRWKDERPECCHVVPLLGKCHYMPSSVIIDEWINELRLTGSRAADFDRPEGIVIHHRQSRTSFKVTLENDDAGKGN